MSAGVISKAFDSFFTTKEIGQGTGLGLSQVHGFAKQSHGHVKIYSELGVGTTLRSIIAAAWSTGTAAHAATQVLVVEDDADVREFVVAALYDLGYQSCTTACWIRVRT
ncbi:MAG TPA: hypothetical protein VMA74_00615 [Dyella sp.]|uniref:hypothetical protein n=1 Tax=Dyella sp. TaxID=1869338 RepID=UPI002B871125|nr:hypothetical protein [Dyella sp.]HUB88207.1 hypothetical protein [Dyella sp.]